MDKAEWRPENANSFVKDAYTAVKNANPDMRFGVSPFGIWANSGSDTPVDGSETKGLEAYSALYCDALSWAKGGYVDYLVPQIYWNFGHSAAPFDNVARWWNANLDGTGVDFYIGHAVYKAVFGISPRRYLIFIRIEKAKMLLQSGATVTSVAEQLGYGSVYHFIRQFRQLTGDTPKQFARSSQKQ
jgi:uncharacterized lipoprotein YddW (UPF0748 family)